MNKDNQYKSGRDICVSVFLIVIMILRLVTENTNLFAFFAFISLIVAICDIYVEVERRYGYHRKRFLIVRGGFIVGGIFFAIIVAIMVIFRWNVSSLLVDELSILALFASLTKGLHCRLLGKYIQGSEENKL